MSKAEHNLAAESAGVGEQGGGDFLRGCGYHRSG